MAPGPWPASAACVVRHPPARRRSCYVVGGPPAINGIGPVPAIPAAGGPLPPRLLLHMPPRPTLPPALRPARVPACPPAAALRRWACRLL